MSDLDSLPTPALLLDRARFDANIERLRRVLRPAGVVFRPHVKTLKSPQAIRAAVGPNAPITVSTLLEARRFAEAGFTDILYAVGILPSKLGAVRALADRGVRMRIVLDDLQVAKAVAAELEDPASGIGVLAEIDCDGHRSGIAPDEDALRRIAETLAARGIFDGVMTHAGGSYQCVGAQAIAAHAELERAGIVRAAQRIREAGLPCPIVSMGSTPTALFAPSLAGVTEVRAGVYMLQDLVMAGVGVCTPADIALSVLCSVIGHRRSGGRLIVDAGWMALSRDRGTAAQAVDQGYGLVCSLDGRLIDGLIVDSTNQEHGLIGRRDGAPLALADYPIGTRLRILPNHACATGAQHDRYHVVGNDARIEARWARFSGW